MNSKDAITIRYPATANLMLDSADRDETKYASPFQFTIQRPNSILNGFFTRIGTTEVVLEWCEPNGYYIKPVEVTLDMSGTQTVTFGPYAFYTAETALDYLVDELNDKFNTTVFGIAISNGSVFLQTSNNQVFDLSGAGVAQFGFVAPEVTAAAYIVGCPDFRPYRYIDFVSSSLTYNQDLKDSSTAPIVRDVLCRWYFSWDTPPQLDAYGFPILMGYTQFRVRRLYNPPKQIRWDKIQPIGQLNFEVYGDQGTPLTSFGNESNWLMTLQVSED